MADALVKCGCSYVVQCSTRWSSHVPPTYKARAHCTVRGGASDAGRVAELASNPRTKRPAAGRLFVLQLFLPPLDSEVLLALKNESLVVACFSPRSSRSFFCCCPPRSSPACSVSSWLFAFPSAVCARAVFGSWAGGRHVVFLEIGSTFWGRVFYMGTFFDRHFLSGWKEKLFYGRGGPGRTPSGRPGGRGCVTGTAGGGGRAVYHDGDQHGGGGCQRAARIVVARPPLLTGAGASSAWWCRRYQCRRPPPPSNFLMVRG